MLAADRVYFGRQEILALGILCDLAALDIVEVDDADRHLRPSKPLARRKPPATRYQNILRSYNDGMEETDIGDARGERVNVAEIAPMAHADDDGLRRGGGRGRLRSWLFCFSARVDLAAKLINTPGVALC